MKHLEYIVSSSGSLDRKAFGRGLFNYENLLIADQTPHTLYDAADLLFDHCQDEIKVRVLELNHKTNTFKDVTHEAIYRVAYMHLNEDLQDESVTIPHWAEEIYASIDKEYVEDY